jgi:hypothetical protein
MRSRIGFRRAAALLLAAMDALHCQSEPVEQVENVSAGPRLDLAFADFDRGPVVEPFCEVTVIRMFRDDPRATR